MSAALLFVVSLSVMIVLLALVNLCLHLFAGRQSPYHDEIERMETYLYSKKPFGTVLAGSGLIGQFKPNFVENGYNLYFPYSGSCTALKVILLANQMPRLILVETNHIFKGVNSGLIDQALGHRWLRLKNALPLTRRVNRPSNLVRMLVRWVKSFVNATENPDENEDKSEKIRMLGQLYDQLPEPGEFAGQLREFKESIDLIRARGTRVLLFEMPVDPLLSKARLFQFQRREIRKALEGTSYHWIAPDPEYPYQTTDGLHLTSSSMQAFQHYLHQQIKSIEKPATPFVSAI